MSLLDAGRGIDTQWPFVGRDDELALVAGLAASGCPGVVIAGAPGVGATRLARECAAIVSKGAAGQAAGGGVAPSAASATRPARVVDDVHLLSGPAAARLREGIRAGTEFTILTSRARKPAADPVRRLWCDDGLHRIDLPPLSEAGAGELLTAALGARIDRSATATLLGRSAGNVRFLRELVLSALAGGVLVRDGDGPWRLTGPVPLSDRIVEIVEAALAELDGPARDYLEVVAYAQPLGHTELAVAGDLAGDTRAGERLERAGLLVSGRNGRRLEMHLCHPLYADVLRAGIPALRAGTIARRLAEAVESATSGDASGGTAWLGGVRRRDDMLRVAAWRMECGGASGQLLLAAAETARWEFDFPMAQRLATAATDAGAGFEAGLLVGQLAGLQGRIAEADATLAALVCDAATDDQRGRLAVARLDMHAYDLGSLADGLRIAEDAEGSLNDPEWRDEITARRLGLLLAIQGPRAQVAVAEPLIARAKGRALAWGCLELAYGLGRIGRLEEALAVADRGFAVHESLADPFEWSAWMHRFMRCDILAHSGHLGGAEALAATEPRVNASDVETQAFLALHQAKVVGDRGHVLTAIRHAETSIGLFRRFGRQQMVRMGLMYLALARALAGQAGAAASAMQEIDDLGLPTTYLTGVELSCVRAWTIASAGEAWTARAQLDAAAREGIDIGDHVGAAFALHSMARLGDPAAALPRLETLAGLISGDLVVARVEHVAALVTGRAVDLAAVSDRFEAMGADLLAAEAAADASVAWRRAGDPHQAAAAQWRTEVLVQTCEGVATPALKGLDVRASLTPAQREVALLAAAGRGNREIADQLTLSVRTVENHLQQVYRKLGLHRDQLAARLGTLA